MKKQKLFVLIKHGADNQDYSGVKLLEYIAPRPQPRSGWQKRRIIS